MTKSLFASKTFWVNLISGAVLFLALPELSTVLGPDAIRYTTLVQAVLNIVLRLVTVEPVSIR